MSDLLRNIFVFCTSKITTEGFVQQPITRNGARNFSYISSSVRPAAQICKPFGAILIFRASFLKIMRRYFFLFLILLALQSSFGQSLRNITINLGPNFIFPKETNKIGKGLFTELNTTVKLTKRSSLIYGIGLSKNFWKTSYDIDTSFQYIASTNGCNCKFYDKSHSTFILSFPFLYRFTFLQNRLLSLSLLAGLESTYSIKHTVQYSRYIRKSNGTLNLGPFYSEESITEKDNSILSNLFQRKAGIETRIKLRKHIHLSSEFSFLFAKQVRILRMGLGFHLTE